MTSFQCITLHNLRMCYISYRSIWHITFDCTTHYIGYVAIIRQLNKRYVHKHLDMNNLEHVTDLDRVSSRSISHQTLSYSRCHAVAGFQCMYCIQLQGLCYFMQGLIYTPRITTHPDQKGEIGSVHNGWSRRFKVFILRNGKPFHFLVPNVHPKKLPMSITPVNPNKMRIYIYIYIYKLVYIYIRTL